METSKISGASSGIHLHMALEYRPHILLQIGNLKAAMGVNGAGMCKVGIPHDTHMGFLVERYIDAELICMPASASALTGGFFHRTL